MRFALLGTHPDGLELAAALVATGRHAVHAVNEPLPTDFAARVREARLVRDVEELLADPAIEAVIVAGKPTVRPAQLRRALQAERHVLCVHPPDASPELGYEAALLRDDVRVTLLPLLPGGRHPALVRLATFVSRGGGAAPIGTMRLCELEWPVSAESLAAPKPNYPIWDTLRALGGAIADVSGFADDVDGDHVGPVLLAGRFEKGGLFRATLLPGDATAPRTLTIHGDQGRALLEFPNGGDGPAYLSWRAANGEWKEEDFAPWDPWPLMVEEFEAALARRPTALSWQDAVTALELDDAARRAVTRRRAEHLEYPEASEEVGFKGTMTLAGCSVLLFSLLLLIVSRWAPAAGWLILPLLALFLGLQILRPLAGRPPAKE